MSKECCIDCGEVTAPEDFPPAPLRRDGRGSSCRKCQRIRSRAAYQRKISARGRVVREPEVVPEGMKRCPDCLQVKSLDAFPTSRSATSGRHSYCKPCHNLRAKETVARLHGSSREYHLRRRYGITVADDDRLSLSRAASARCVGSVRRSTSTTIM